MTGESTKRLALRLNARQFTAYSGRPPSRPEWTAARVALVTASAVLVLLLGVVLVSGLRLVARDFPSLWIVPGTLLVAFAWTLRPRIGRMETDWAVVNRPDAPALFELIDQVARASGAPVPHHVALDYEFNAAAGVFGLLRRRRLCLGLPLWGILSPQQRVALLAHEFAHFVNADPARSLLTQPALSTPGVLADLVKPSSPLTGLSETNIALEIVESLLRPLQRLAERTCLWTQAGLLAIASRDHQRAEYCADAFAVRLAGTTGTVALMDDLVASFQLSGAVEAAERRTRATRRAHPGVVEWRAAAVECRARLDLAELRKQSVVAEASMWAHHPPSGLRARIVESWPRTEPALVLSDEDSARIDAELHRWYAKAGRDLVWDR